MTATLTTARNDIVDIFKVKWDADTPAVNGGAIPVVSYDNVGFTPPTNAAYAKLRIRHQGGNQATLRGDPSVGATRFTKLGTVIVSVYQPISGADTTLAEALAMIAKEAFEGQKTINQVWFRNVFAGFTAIEDKFVRFDVNANFLYDEFV
jgi:hypothetical protein